VFDLDSAAQLRDAAFEFSVFYADRAGTTGELACCADPMAAIEAAEALRQVFPRSYVAAHHPDSVDFGVSGDFSELSDDIPARWLAEQEEGTLFRIVAQKYGVNLYDGGSREQAERCLVAGEWVE